MQHLWQWITPLPVRGELKVAHRPTRYASKRADPPNPELLQTYRGGTKTAVGNVKVWRARLRRKLRGFRDLFHEYDKKCFCTHAEIRNFW
jgi:hypothetical protein